jgi:hypothetical protein
MSDKHHLDLGKLTFYQFLNHQIGIIRYIDRPIDYFGHTQNSIADIGGTFKTELIFDNKIRKFLYKDC